MTCANAGDRLKSGDLAKTPNHAGRPGKSPLFFALAGITLALSSWGLFRLFTQHAGMPPFLAVVAVGGLDLAAVLIGKHALTVAEDGDSSAPWNLTLILLTGLGAYAQFESAALAGDARAIGIVSMAFPIVTVLLFEGQLRRSYRLNGRTAGRLNEPRATVDLVTWLLYPRLAFRATKLGVLDRGLDAGSALIVAERQLRIESEAATRRPPRRALRRTYRAELANGEVVDLAEPDSSPDVRTIHVPAVRTGPDTPHGTSETSDDAGPDVLSGPETSEGDVPDVRRRGDLARAVERAVSVVGDDFPRVLEVVQIAYPDVEPESVRRTLNRRRTG